MGKEVKMVGKEMQWPAVCASCLEPANKKYEIEKSFCYGKVTRTISVKIPLCEKHFQIVSEKTATQKMLSKVIPLISLIVGGLIIFAYINCIEGSLGSKIFAAILLGLGAFAILWTALYFIFVPMFATPGAKKVRGSVKLKKFWPPETIQYEFENIGFADKVIGLNEKNIVPI